MHKTPSLKPYFVLSFSIICVNVRWMIVLGFALLLAGGISCFQIHAQPGNKLRQLTWLPAVDYNRLSTRTIAQIFGHCTIIICHFFPGNNKLLLLMVKNTLSVSYYIT